MNIPKTFFPAKLVLLIALMQLLILTNLYSQRLEDVVYLSNGSIIHGTLITDSTSGNIKILNHAGDTWVFERTEIDSVKREKPYEYKAMLFNKPGFEFNISGEFLIRSGSNAIGNAVIPGLGLLFAYRFNSCLSAGTEISMEFYERMAVPVSASLRLRSSDRSLSPFLLLRAGYTIPAEKRLDDWEYTYQSFGGIHTTLGAGIERILNENSSFLFTFSYHYQELNYHLTPLNEWVQERDRTEAFSRLRLTLGYVFK